MAGLPLANEFSKACSLPPQVITTIGKLSELSAEYHQMIHELSFKRDKIIPDITRRADMSMLLDANRLKIKHLAEQISLLEHTNQTLQENIYSAKVREAEFQFNIETPQTSALNDLYSTGMIMQNWLKGQVANVKNKYDLPPSAQIIFTPLQKYVQSSEISLGVFDSKSGENSVSSLIQTPTAGTIPMTLSKYDFGSKSTLSLNLPEHTTQPLISVEETPVDHVIEPLHPTEDMLIDEPNDLVITDIEYLILTQVLQSFLLSY